MARSQDRLHIGGSLESGVSVVVASSNATTISRSCSEKRRKPKEESLYTLERSFIQTYLGTDTGRSSFSPPSGSEDTHERGELWLPEIFSANKLSRLYTRHAACRSCPGCLGGLNVQCRKAASVIGNIMDNTMHKITYRV